MATHFNVDGYLARIGYAGVPAVTEACLRDLHRHAVMAIPFEATDIHFGKTISMELEAIYEKVVRRKRGGFCYELNYLFHELLQAVGFRSTMISASVYNEGVYGPPFDHLCLAIELNGLWLTDVGFGDLFFEPLPIRAGERFVDRDHDYQLQLVDPLTYDLLAAAPGAADFEPKYRFDLLPRQLADFSEQCRVTQTDPESHFVRNFICTLPTPEGRKTIRNGLLKIRRGNVKTEHQIKDETELLWVMAEHFGLEQGRL